MFESTNRNYNVTTSLSELSDMRFQNKTENTTACSSVRNYIFQGIFSTVNRINHQPFLFRQREMGACASKFGDQARQEEGLPQPKEDCAGTSDKGGRPREVGSVEVEEKKKVVGESTGGKKEDWSKDETKRRSLSILFKEVFSGILFREVLFIFR